MRLTFQNMRKRNRRAMALAKAFKKQRQRLHITSEASASSLSSRQMEKSPSAAHLKRTRTSQLDSSTSNKSLSLSQDQSTGNNSNIPSWKKFGEDKKEELWTYVTKHYIVPPEGRKCVLDAIRDAWRGCKCRLKKNHFLRYDTNESRLEHRPKRVPLSMFKQLLKIWEDDSHKTISARNTRNRLELKKNNIMHTAGPRSFARVAAEWKKKNKTTKDPSPAQMFTETRKEKTKHKSNDPRDQIINELKHPNEEQITSDTVATIASIFGGKDEKRRRLRLYGRGVTCTQLKQKAFEEQILKKRDEDMKAMAADYEQKRQKDKAEVAHVLRSLVMHIQQHCPNMPIDSSILGSFLVDDPSLNNSTSDCNALELRHPQSSTSTTPNCQEVNLMEDDEDEELT